MAILITGAAGFIGFHVAQALLARGERVLGLDSVNDYYDPALKRARLALLEEKAGFAFTEGDLADPGTLAAASLGEPLSTVVHLAAQAGVRYSLENPRAYGRSNLMGHLEVLEYCRGLGVEVPLVYASSSSVYGLSTPAPFEEAARADDPVSLYAATKRSAELMSTTYSHLYGLRQTGLRFFTVYGPWGRPDMAYWKFTKAILEGRPIDLYNRGEMRRDFSYIDDVVAGVLGVIDHPPRVDDGAKGAHRLYNIGANQPETLMDFVEAIEKATGKQAEKRLLAMQPGDVYETFADTKSLEALCGFRSATPIHEGLPRFVAWYKSYYEL